MPPMFAWFFYFQEILLSIGLHGMKVKTKINVSWNCCHVFCTRNEFIKSMGGDMKSLNHKTNFVDRFFNINPKIRIYDLDGTIIDSIS